MTESSRSREQRDCQFNASTVQPFDHLQAGERNKREAAKSKRRERTPYFRLNVLLGAHGNAAASPYCRKIHHGDHGDYPCHPWFELSVTILLFETDSSNA